MVLGFYRQVLKLSLNKKPSQPKNPIPTNPQEILLFYHQLNKAMQNGSSQYFQQLKSPKFQVIQAAQQNQIPCYVLQNTPWKIHPVQQMKFLPDCGNPRLPKYRNPQSSHSKVQ